MSSVLLIPALSDSIFLVCISGQQQEPAGGSLCSALSRSSFPQCLCCVIWWRAELITPYATNSRYYPHTGKLLETGVDKTSRGYHYHHNYHHNYQCPCTDSTPSWLRGASGQLVTFTNNFLHGQVLFQMGNQNFYSFNFCTIPITRNNRWFTEKQKILLRFSPLKQKIVMFPRQSSFVIMGSSLPKKLQLFASSQCRTNQ